MWVWWETEVNYFNSVIKEINKTLPVNYRFKVKIVGKGINPTFLVKEADKLLNDIDVLKRAAIPYAKIFVVFDKDDFDDRQFNKAINMCEKRGYIPLWSNQAFEFWFLLHFNYIDSPINRKFYEGKINECFKNKGSHYKYRKNDKDIYYKLDKYGSLENAYKNALKIANNYIKTLPSKAESCTTVYKFFDEIKNRIDEIK